MWLVLYVREDENEEVVVGGSLDSVHACTSTVAFSEPIINLDRFSSFQKFARVINYVYGYINRLKRKLFSKNPTKYCKFEVLSNSFVLGKKYLIRRAQEEAFPEVFRFFRGENTTEKSAMRTRRSHSVSSFQMTIPPGNCFFWNRKASLSVCLSACTVLSAHKKHSVSTSVIIRG